MNSTTWATIQWRLAVLLFSCAALIAAPAGAVQTFVPDNGFGTAQMPILADYTTSDDDPMQIVNGLPVATTIDIDAILETPTVYVEVPGGSLGGTKSGGGDGTLFNWTMNGTGALAGFNRVINMPHFSSVLTFNDPPFDTHNSGMEVHAAPRTNGAQIQTFNTDMFRMFSQITGDSDFDLLRLVGGTDFGLPSPGLTKLRKVGSDWEVYSIFDLTYRIDFVGKAGSALAGMSGSSTGTVRLTVGEFFVPEPTSAALAGLGTIALGLLAGRRRLQVCG